MEHQQQPKHTRTKRNGRTLIEIRTNQNGYSLRFGHQQYLYFTTEELINGFLYHVCCGEADYCSNEFAKEVLTSLAEMKPKSELVKEIGRLKAEQKKLIIQLRGAKRTIQILEQEGSK